MVTVNRTAVKWTARTRRDQARRPCWYLLLMLLTAVVSPWSLAASEMEDLDATVQYLISYVEESDVTFERNARRYTGREAAQHISKKYQHYRDDIETPEKFIDLCATGSLMTGKPYYIITQQGEQLPSSDWLKAELSVYRLRNVHGKR